MNPAHLLTLVRQQNAAMAANGSAAVQEAHQEDLQRRWADLEVGDAVMLTSDALRALQGKGDALPLDPSTTTARLLRISPERDCALVGVTLRLAHGGWGSLASEFGRDDILPVLDESPAVEQFAAPPAPPPPPPIRRPPSPGPSRGRSRWRGLPSVW